MLHFVLEPIIGYFLSLATISSAAPLFKNTQTVQNPEQVISPTLAVMPTNVPVAAVKGVQSQTNSNQIDCVGPDNKIFKATMAACEKLNRDWGKEPNYMVNCGIHEKCGGGSVWISNSACKKTICCTYSDGRSVFLYDNSQCKSNQTYPIYIPIATSAPLPTFAPWPTYAPLPTYAPMPTMEPYVYVPPTLSPDQCKSQVISYYAPLLNNCMVRFSAGSTRDACIEILSSQRYAALAQCGN